MKIVYFLFIFFIFLQAEEDFLSNDEYARMLYENPRGIACGACHGKRGEGGILTAYTIEKNGEKIKKEIKAPRINNLGIKEFKKAFEKKKRYMPSYYLTEKELAYIYYYLLKQRKSDEDKKK
jgi:mono/diheme cytochrome c family protein